MSILGLDIGTTGTKAIVFDEDGKELATSYEEYYNIFPRPGWVEFDVNLMWKKIFDVIETVNNHPDVVKDPVTALSVSTMGESFTPVDNKGNTLYNTIYSNDARSVKELEQILSVYSSSYLFNITGYPPGFICPLNKSNYIDKINMLYEKNYK